MPSAGVGSSTLVLFIFYFYLWLIFFPLKLWYGNKEVKTDIKELKSELKEDIARVETTLKEDSKNLTNRMDRFMFWSLGLTVTSTFLILGFIYKTTPH